MSTRALSPTEVVTQLSRLNGWQLRGDGAQLGIEKAFDFEGFQAVMLFANAVAWIAQHMNHHPTMTVQYQRCTLHWHTHDAAGISALDFAAAQRVDAWLAHTRDADARRQPSPGANPSRHA